MRALHTVLGPVHPDQMGMTAEHEHILWGPPGWEWSPRWWWRLPKVYERCVHDLIEFRDAGGGTFVDVSGIGLGRDIEFYALLSQVTGVHIVCCTGFWPERGILGYFAVRDIDYHTELYVRELTQGMGKTNVRAGIIKVGAAEDQLTRIEELTYRAAARAAKRTGCCVTTHGVNTVRRQAEVLLEEGLDPRQVVIGHLDAYYSLDLERDKDLARRGFYVGYDHIGIERTWSPAPYAMPDEDRALMVKEMIEAGFLNQIILSCDINSFSLGWQWSAPYVRKSNAAHLIRDFVPKLRQVGVTPEQIDTMLIENPQRVLPF